MGVIAQMALPWTDLPFLLMLTRAGTLSGAARLLKLDRTTISRRIDQLEKTLGETLFDRSNGRFSLAPYGRRVFAAAESAEQELFFLERQHEGQHKHGGRIRVSLSGHLLMTLADCFQAFMREHPNILLELIATDRILDLNHFESDVGLRVSRTGHGDLLSIKIGKPIYALYRRKDCDGAELRYIARPGEDRVPEYVRKNAPQAEIGIVVDGLVSTKELIARGIGIGILPRYFGDRDSRIECFSEPLQYAGWFLFIVLRPEQRRLHRIKTFVDHMQRYLTRFADFEPESSEGEIQNG